MTFSCTNFENKNKVGEIEKLQTENDSLKNVLLNGKYNTKKQITTFRMWL